MNHHHLTVFLAVCEHMNMTRAAGALYMTQPSVSQMIAELERYYDVRLFERLKHRLYLTTAGERLLSYARHIVNLEAQAKKELADLRQAGVIRVGASQTVGAYLLPEIVARYHRLLPEVEIFTRVENTREIERLLLEDKLDLGLVEGLIHSPDIVEETVLDDELTIVCAPGHPLAGRGQLAPAELAPFAFIVREEGSGTREVFANQMQSAGVAWQEAGIYNSSEAIKRAVELDLGLAVLPTLAIRQEIESGSICPLRVDGLNLRRKFNLVFHRQKYFTRAMREFSVCLNDWRKGNPAG